MPTRLVAIRAPAHRFAATLRDVWAAGDAALPLPWDTATGGADDAARLIGRLRPAAVVEVHDDGVAHVEELADDATVPSGIALVVATSGSTGQPKGVMLARRALDLAVTASVRVVGATRGDRFVAALPAHHVAGLAVHLRAWACGTDAHVVEPGDIDAMLAHDGAHLALVPTQLRRALDRADGALPWRSVLVGGGPIDEDTLSAARAAGPRVVTSYGMTETCGGCVHDGTPSPYVEVAISPEGRIRLRGDVLFDGYLGAADSPFDPDGWWTTNDIGRLVDGRLQVDGRADAVVVSGGENVPLAAVTAALRSHPAVRDAAATSVGDPEWGAVVVAVVAARAPVELAELRAHVRSQLPPAYAPRHLVLVDQIPRTALGKPDGERLAAIVADDVGDYRPA